VVQMAISATVCLSLFEAILATFTIPAALARALADVFQTEMGSQARDGVYQKA
jgi:hypothetical protein